MGAICGVIGKNAVQVVKRMAGSMAHRCDTFYFKSGKNYALAASSEIPARSPVLVDGIPLVDSQGMADPKVLRRLVVDAGTPERVSLRGSYALALRAKAPEEWWLLRDRLGVKPLYYYVFGGCLYFASELKALLASGVVPKRLNLLSVDRYLTLRCVPGTETIIQDVYRVAPGHALVFRRGSCTLHEFDGFDTEPMSISRAEAAREIERLLDEAVAQSGAGGLLWSGGIDCASLGVLDPSRRLIHVTLHRAWQHEQRLARESARRLELPLYIMKASALTETVMRKTLYHLDEPLADVSAFPLWLILSEAGTVKDHLLWGYGADEMLGGYPRYHFMDRAQGHAKSLIPINLLSAVLPALPPNAFIQRGSRFLASMGENEAAYFSLLAVFNESEREELYTEAMKAVVHGEGGSAALVSEYFDDGDLTQNQLKLDLRVTLPQIGLTQADRISAALGVTLDLPYLHDPLLDLVTKLPSSVKFGVRSKPLLRLAMQKRLPGRIRQRARRGFHIPQEGPVMRVVEQFAEQTLTPERIESSGLFIWPCVERIMRTHSHNIYRRRQFWSLLMFFGWYREMLED